VGGVTDERCGGQREFKIGEESQYGKEKYMKLTKNSEVRQDDEKKRRRISRKEGGLLVQCVWEIH
jgi:hypothetical protein